MNTETLSKTIGQGFEILSTDLSAFTKYRSRAFAFSDNLFWGDCISAYDQSFLQQFGITHCISLADNSFYNNLPLDLLVDKTLSSPIRNDLPLNANFSDSDQRKIDSSIETLLENKDVRLYVHCIKGEDRTPAILSSLVPKLGLLHKSNPKPLDTSLTLADEKFLRLESTIRPENKSVLIVSRSPTFNRTIEKLLVLEKSCCGEVFVSDDLSSIERYPGSLVISEFLWTSSTGIDLAQGLRLAHALLQRKQTCLLISPLCLEGEAGSWYWDLASKSPLASKVLELFESGYTVKAASESIDRLSQTLGIDISKVNLGHD